MQIESNHWSTYWLAGQLHSCPNAFTGNYSGVLRELWEQFFEACSANSRVLDIGTGNGAVALIARDVSTRVGTALAVFGIDHAQIDPKLAAARQGLDPSGIRFAGGVAIEDTGLPDGNFAAISSQFAIEYARAPAAAREMHRILEPRGRIRCLIHHAHSEPVQTAHADSAILERLKQKPSITDRTRAYLTRVRSCTTTAALAEFSATPAGREQLEALKQASLELRSLTETESKAVWLEGIAVQIATTLQEISLLQFDSAARRLDSLDGGMLEHSRRLKDIRSAAWDAARLAEFTQSLSDLGFEVAAPNVVHDQSAHILAWRVDATKR